MLACCRPARHSREPRAARGARLRSRTRQRTRSHAGGHQAVPVPRSGRARRACRVDVRAGPVRRMGAVPADHLPLAERALVPGVRDARHPRLGGAPPVDRHDHVPRRCRCALGLPDARCVPARCAVGRARVPTLTVPARLRIAHLAAPASLGVARVDRRADRARNGNIGRSSPHHVATSTHPVERPCTHRPDRRDGGFDERHHAGDDRAGPGAVDRARRLATSAPLATGRRGDRPDRGAVHGGVDLVDGDAVRPITQRAGRAGLHRDAGGRQPQRHRHRGPPRPGLLAVLPA